MGGLGERLRPCRRGAARAGEEARHGARRRAVGVGGEEEQPLGVGGPGHGGALGAPAEGVAAGEGGACGAEEGGKRESVQGGARRGCSRVEGGAGPRRAPAPVSFVDAESASRLFREAQVTAGGGVGGSGPAGSELVPCGPRGRREVSTFQTGWKGAEERRREEDAAPPTFAAREAYEQVDAVHGRHGRVGDAEGKRRARKLQGLDRLLRRPTASQTLRLSRHSCWLPAPRTRRGLGPGRCADRLAFPFLLS